MPKFDMDAAKAARIEALEETPSVTFHGVEFTMPPELPFEVFTYLGDMRADRERGPESVNALIETFFGERAQEFVDMRPSMEDIEGLIKYLLTAYGWEGEDQVGESSASASS